MQAVSCSWFQQVHLILVEIRTCYVGPPGKHFGMTEKVLQLGRPVLMAGFPAASDQVFPRQPAGQPMITAGTICCYDRDFELAAATYQGGRSSATAPLNSWDLLHRTLSPSSREQCSSLVAHTHVIWNAACTSIAGYIAATQVCTCFATTYPVVILCICVMFCVRCSNAKQLWSPCSGRYMQPSGRACWNMLPLG